MHPSQASPQSSLVNHSHPSQLAYLSAFRAAERLPQDLLHQIFAHVRWTASHDWLRFVDDHPLSLEEFQNNAKNALQSLHAASLVCTAWYTAAVQYLYGFPCLPFPVDATRLVRTLQQAPGITQLIKRIYVAAITDIYGTSSSHSHSSDMTYISLDLLCILTSVLQLESMVISLQGQNPDAHAILLISSSISNRLRRLTLYEAVLPSFEGLALPLLRTLCLRNSTIDLLRLPFLPNLETLQIVHSNLLIPVKKKHSNNGSTSTSLLSYQRLFPCLRSLQLFNNQFSSLSPYYIVSPSTNDVHSALRESYNAVFIPFSLSLASLSLIGSNETALLQSHVSLSENDSNALRCRHMTLGIIPSNYNFLSTWEIPSKVEILEVFINARSISWPGAMFSCHRGALTIIQQCLVYNEERIINSHLSPNSDSRLEKLRPRCKLRSLKIHASTMEYRKGGLNGNLLTEENSGLGKIINEIRRFCRMKGVHFEFDFVYNANSWATERVISTL
ncbi:hypothetical protein C8Q75DRAFT_138260 [Abortiporus biennis]|nr:hypothetical protein C8Q75DRAFT_138260 [Abortiporus biennis]